MFGIEHITATGLARQRGNHRRGHHFTAKTWSSQSSEYSLIEIYFLRVLGASAVNRLIEKILRGECSGSRGLLLSCLFSEQAQTFQDRAIRYRKNDRRVFGRFVLEVMPVPGRHEEAVVGAPVECFAGAFLGSDMGRTFALDDVIDGAAGVTLWLCGDSRWNELHPAADGGHGRPAGQRMCVLQ